MLSKFLFHRAGKTWRVPARILSVWLLVALLVGGQGATPAHAIPPVRYVSAAGTSLQGCTTWGDACSLQHALDLSSSGDQIWVRHGNYLPTVRANPANTDPRTVTFTLKDGVSLYGGFLGTETILSDRDPAFYTTILSGNIASGQLVTAIGTKGAVPITDVVTLAAGTNITLIQVGNQITVAATARLSSIEVFTTSTTYTVPAGVTAIMVECVAGGGAGGGATGGGTNAGAGAGGGAGSYARKFIVGPAASYAIGIGAGGTPGATGNNPGGA